MLDYRLMVPSLGPRMHANRHESSAKQNSCVSGTTTFADAINGSGRVVKLGSDTLVLTANDTYSGGTTIQDGTLAVGTLIAADQPISTALGAGNVNIMVAALAAPGLKRTQNPLDTRRRVRCSSSMASKASLSRCCSSAAPSRA